MTQPEAITPVRVRPAFVGVSCYVRRVAVRLSVCFVVALLAAACHRAPATDDAHAKFTAVPDDEGVFFSVDGPKDATYVMPHATFTADSTGHGSIGVAAANLPPKSPMDVVVRWNDGAPHEQKLSVDYTFAPAAPRVAFVAKPDSGGLGGLGPALEVPCGGACAGSATFVDGRATVDVDARGATGCLVRVGSESHRFAEVPVWDDRGTIHRSPVRMAVDVTDVVMKARLPDALTKDVSTKGTLECPDRATVELALTFGVGAAITALRGHYHVIPSGSEWSASSRRRNAIVLHGAQFLDELDLSTELVRYYGKATTGDDVDLVGKILEYPHTTENACAASGARIDVERRDFGIEIHDAAGKLIAKTTVVAAAPDCARLVTEPKKPDPEGVDHRVVRPKAAAIDAFVKSVLRP